MPLGPEDIGLPWDEPIAWRKAHHLDRKCELQAMARDNTTHLVREVIVSNSRFKNASNFVQSRLTRTQIEDTLEEADQQFGLLAERGINVPDHDWHVFFDPQDGLERTLARVAIIEGIELNRIPEDQLNQPGYPSHDDIQQWFTGVTDYHQTVPYSIRLSDVLERRQYMYGHLKGQGTAIAGNYLADIEPRIGF